MQVKENLMFEHLMCNSNVATFWECTAKWQYRQSLFSNYTETWTEDVEWLKTRRCVRVYVCVCACACVCARVHVCCQVMKSVTTDGNLWRKKFKTRKGVCVCACLCVCACACVCVCVCACVVSCMYVCIKLLTSEVLFNVFFTIIWAECHRTSLSLVSCMSSPPPV